MNPEIKEIKEESPFHKCVFCSKSKLNDIEWGPMYRLNDITLHYFCMLFSSGLKQNGEDNEGILGFLLEDLRKEIRRGEKLKCKICGLNRATVGCSVKSCKWSFHFSCGVDHGTLHQFSGSFASFCRKHKPIIKIPEQLSWQCEVCYNHVENNEDSRRGNPVWPPCCKKRVFHRYCIQQHAQNSGYCFSCPSCRDTNEFTDAMKDSGVYVPEQDASWERTPGAYDDLYAQYSKCDAEECQCPQGRKHDSKEHRSWKIVRCGGCGSSAVHYSCGQLAAEDWDCPGCIAVLKAGPILRGAKKIVTDNHVSSSDVEGEVTSGDEGLEDSDFETIHENCRLRLASRSSLVGIERQAEKIDHPSDILQVSHVSDDDDDDDKDGEAENNERNKAGEPLEKIIDEKKKIIFHKTYKQKIYRMESVADSVSTSSDDEDSSGNNLSSVVGSRFANVDAKRSKTHFSNFAIDTQVRLADNRGKCIKSLLRVKNLDLDEHYGNSTNMNVDLITLSDDEDSGSVSIISKNAGPDLSSIPVFTVSDDDDVGGPESTSTGSLDSNANGHNSLFNSSSAGKQYPVPSSRGLLGYTSHRSTSSRKRSSQHLSSSSDDDFSIIFKLN